MCGDWEGRRVSQTHCLLTLCGSRHRTALSGAASSPVTWDSLSPVWGCDVTDDRRKSPKPQAGSQSGSPLSPGIPQGPGALGAPAPRRGHLGGRSSVQRQFCPLEAPGPRRPAEPAGTSTRPSRVPGGSPRPTLAPEHPWILAHSCVHPQGPGPRASISALSLSPWTGPSASPGLHLLVCDKGAAMWCSPPRIYPETRDCAQSVLAHCGAQRTAVPTADPPYDFQATDGHPGACSLLSDSYRTRQGWA